MLRTSMRRMALVGLLGLLNLASCWAQEGRPVRLIAPTPAGASLDATARLLAQRASGLTGEAWVVENRPGANSVIGAELVARSPADGRALLMSGASLPLIPLLQKVSFSPMEELTPVIQLTAEHWVILSASTLPASNVTQLAELAASRPGGLSCASPPGPGVMACEQLKERLGGNVVVVPYLGIAPALTALLGGHADLLVSNPDPAEKHVQAGRLRVLGHTGVKGAPWSSQPVLASVFPGFVLQSFMGVLAPARTPPARIHELNQLFNQVLAQPDVQALLRERSQEPVGGSPEVFGETMRIAQQRYGEVIRRLDLGPK